MVEIRPVNVLGSVMGGLQVRDTMQGMERRNALAQAAEAFGVDSPQFKNALAVADPVRAYAFQQGDRRMDMQADQFGQTMDLNERQFASQEQDRQARLQIARQNAARQGAALAMRMSAEERAQDAAALDRALAAASTAQTPEDWDRIMGGFGEQGAPFVGQFDRREEIFASVMGLRDALEMRPEPSLLSPEEQAQAARIEAGLAPDADTVARLGRDDSSAAEQRISRLTENLAPQFGERAREIAVAITDGRYRVDQGRVIDAATGAIITPPPAETTAQADPTRPAPAGPGLYERADDATGFVPTLGRASSATLGQLPLVGGLFQAPDMVGAGQAYLQAQNELIRSMSINPRFPVGEINRLREEMGIVPGMLQSPSDVRVRLRELDGYLAQKIENERAVLADPTIPRDIRDNAAQAIRDMDAFRSIAGVPQNGQRDRQGGGAASVPQSFLSNEQAKSIAQRNGVTIEELWENLPPEAQQRYGQ